MKPSSYYNETRKKGAIIIVIMVVIIYSNTILTNGSNVSNNACSQQIKRSQSQLKIILYTPNSMPKFIDYGRFQIKILGQENNCMNMSILVPQCITGTLITIVFSFVIDDDDDVPDDYDYQVIHSFIISYLNRIVNEFCY